VPGNPVAAEFTVKAVILGVLFGLHFRCLHGLSRAPRGLTVSASIPIAVLAISVLKRLGGSTILENNIVQTSDRRASRWRAAWCSRSRR
jgi:uncharacterized oligopeptide transporter (OPT) family protein